MKTKKVKLSTIIRAIVLGLTCINNLIIVIAQTMGLVDNTVYLWISFILTFVISIASYWYNNDWSALAKTTGEVFDMAKDGKITKEELQDFIDNHKKE